MEVIAVLKSLFNVTTEAERQAQRAALQIEREAEHQARLEADVEREARKAQAQAKANAERNRREQVSSMEIRWHVVSLADVEEGDSHDRDLYRASVPDLKRHIWGGKADDMNDLRRGDTVRVVSNDGRVTRRDVLRVLPDGVILFENRYCILCNSRSPLDKHEYEEYEHYRCAERI